MKQVRHFYEHTINTHSRRVRKLQKEIHRLGSIRLILVAGAIATLWLLKEQPWVVPAVVLLLYAGVFALLMIRHTFLAQKKAYGEILVELSSNELKGLDCDFSAFDGAPERIDPEHPFSLDLDVFGEHSLFQSLNRTVTQTGGEQLAEWLLNPLTDNDAIRQRQESLRELASLTELRQDFYVKGRLGGQAQAEDKQRLSQLASAPWGFASGFFRRAVHVVPLVWTAVFAGLLLGYIPLPLFGVLFTLSAGIAYLPLRRINALHGKVNKMEKILVAHAELMQCIESQSFTSKGLSDLRQQLVNNKGCASRAIRKLSALIGILDQGATLTAILLNIFTFRDLRACISIEQWRSNHGAETPGWLDALARFDALSSLAGFAFNHPDYAWPKLSGVYFTLSGKALGHPLMPRNQCVRNDLHLGESPRFLIITGANMAGKSTFLRTTGVNVLLTCIGAPVCAEELTLSPPRLLTSLRTSDSLAGGESYFLAELKRLKRIIDCLKGGEKLFILLDEILKGTNSTDKQKGSLALMKQLIAYQTSGLIATHDSALGLLEKEFPRQVKNYRFEAEILDDALVFSRQMKEGIAQNMNATFLMRKMGITI
ncbi:MAG: DNA mismatch repair protein MutS [Tannerellaceae bacterium]|jgi:hypothetical protein|nr:DNA mismatch repair protein MutS [Tannerellaceae bacterium]